jgi:hypothetical protein
MKRFTAVILALALMFGVSALAEEPLRSGDFTYALREDGTAEITGYTGASDTVEIPAKVNGIAVTAIGDGAFFLQNGIKQVIIPEGVTCMGAVAFMLCRDLVRVSLPDSLRLFFNNPFAYCDRLKIINVSPDHEYLEQKEGALYSKPDSRLLYCPMDKTEFAVAEGTLEIGDMAFSSCLDLEKVTLPDSVYVLCDRSFENCISLKELILPESVMYIGTEAFIQCESLESITLPAGIININNDAFAGCPAGLTASVVKGSYSESYCKENGIAVVYAQ